MGVWESPINWVDGGGRDRGGKFNATGSSLYVLEYMLAKKKSISKNKGGKFLKKLWCCAGGRV